MSGKDAAAQAASSEGVIAGSCGIWGLHRRGSWLVLLLVLVLQQTKTQTGWRRVCAQSCLGAPMAPVEAARLRAHPSQLQPQQRTQQRTQQTLLRWAEPISESVHCTSSDWAGQHCRPSAAA